MNEMVTLKRYEDWKHCISVLCGIPLTMPYIEKRLTALRDSADYTTQKFVATWGEQHRLRTIGWLGQSQQEGVGQNEDNFFAERE